MAHPPAVPQQPWQSPAAEPGKAPALEPIDLPPAIEQGVDMIYIDEELVPRSVHDNNSPLADMNFAAWSGAPVDLFTSVNPIYTDLRRGLVKYQQRWGDLPQVTIPSGPTLKAGTTGERVALLRQRLGLGDSGTYDTALSAKVKEFQAIHGLKDDGIAGAGTIDALNRGAEYYEQLIFLNMERAKRLPAPEEQAKYAIVDAGDARLSLWENGRKVDEMKVIVGIARQHLIFAVGQVAGALRQDAGPDQAPRQLGRDVPIRVHAGIFDISRHHRRCRLGFADDDFHLIDLAPVLP